MGRQYLTLPKFNKGELAKPPLKNQTCLINYFPQKTMAVFIDPSPYQLVKQAQGIIRRLHFYINFLQWKSLSFNFR